MGTAIFTPSDRLTITWHGSNYAVVRDAQTWCEYTLQGACKQDIIEQYIQLFKHVTGRPFTL